jgi:hypothetical protein
LRGEVAVKLPSEHIVGVRFESRGLEVSGLGLR